VDLIVTPEQIEQAMPADVVLALTLTKDGEVVVFSRVETTPETLASALHSIADSFIDGTITPPVP
jgi:hypothetical protein